MFDASEVAALVSAANVSPKSTAREVEIASRLSEITASFLLNWRWQQKPAPSKIVKRLNAVHSAANELLVKLSRCDNLSEKETRYRLTAQAAMNVLTPELENLATGSERLRIAIDAVKDIAAWSAAAKLREMTKKGRKVGHHGDEAMQRLIGDLNGVWLEFWDRLPGASTNDHTKEIGGPYIRFVRKFLELLEQRLSDEVLNTNPGLKEALLATPAAIRKRLLNRGKSSHLKT